jgi:SAM-dependent methyltransferase
MKKNMHFKNKSKTKVKKDIKTYINKIFYFGWQNHCPICKSNIRIFKPICTTCVRLNAICPVCYSLERHRMIWLFLNQETDLFSPIKKKMLHIAPEDCLISKFSCCDSIDYLTADLNNSAMVKMDLTDIQYSDDSFDIIYCSHVLEHIPDDAKAMSELSRVLKPDGWAILQVPILREQTYEDLTITDPQEREKLFGQSDHVRVYGCDYKSRLENAGFRVSVIPYLEKFDLATRKKFGFSMEKDDIYFCEVQ